MHSGKDRAILHFVTDSAITPREPRRASTTHALIRSSRRLTAERGFAGFTVEDLCTDAGISRRTFFNYFASKDDAVLGLPLERTDGDAVAAFLERRSAPIAEGQLSPYLLTDLAVLAEARWRQMDVEHDTLADLLSAVEREPRLLARIVAHAHAEEDIDTRLIEQREGLRAGDPRARVAASIVGTIARLATGAFLQPGNAEPITDIYNRHVAAAADLFASQRPPKGHR